MVAPISWPHPRHMLRQPYIWIGSKYLQTHRPLAADRPPNAPHPRVTEASALIKLKSTQTSKQKIGLFTGRKRKLADLPFTIGRVIIYRLATKGPVYIVLDAPPPGYTQMTPREGSSNPQKRRLSREATNQSKFILRKWTNLPSFIDPGRYMA